ncbi:hypothetical protein RI054_37g139420 [Pseudoscourfieldia marina]
MSCKRREKRLTASMLFNSFKGVERYSLDALQYLVAMFMRRDDVAEEIIRREKASARGVRRILQIWRTRDGRLRIVDKIAM